MKKLFLLLLFTSPAIAQYQHGKPQPGPQNTQVVNVPYSGTVPYGGQAPYSGTTPLTVDLTAAPGCTAAFAGSTLTVTCGNVPPPTNCTFSVSPTGGADNTVWMNAITSAKGACVEIKPGSYKLNPFTPPAGTNLSCDDGVTVNDMPGYGNYVPMFWMSAANVTIAGVGPNHTCTFAMPNSYQTNINDPNEDTNQYKHCFLFQPGATNVVLKNFSVTKCGGDGFAVAAGNHITLDSLDSSANIRQGLTFNGPSDAVTITGGKFHDGRFTGIDFEPNKATDSITHLIANNVQTYRNAQGGMSFGFFNLGPQATLSVTFNNYSSTDDKQGGIGFFNSNNGSDAAGSVICNNCKVTRSQYDGTYGRKSNGGWVMTFNNLVVADANQGGQDPHYGTDASIGVNLTGGGTGVAGGVVWNTVVITGGHNCMDIPSNAKAVTVSGTCKGNAIHFP